MITLDEIRAALGPATEDGGHYLEYGKSGDYLVAFSYNDKEQVWMDAYNPNGTGLTDIELTPEVTPEWLVGFVKGFLKEKS